MKNQFLIIIVLSALTISFSCCNRKTVSGKEEKKEYRAAITTEAGPPVIVYKTKENYNELVPVILSADKKEVISYPAPGDLYYQGDLAYPLELGDGYLLDRRGINEYVAFIEMTYTEYAELDKAPTPEELFKIILDDDPLLEMYHCGSRYDYDNLEDEMIRKSEEGDFKSCTKLR